ncbi:hypothetical protein [Streptomyces microflavus]
MDKKTLARRGFAAGTGWAHPYGHGPFSPFLYADGGDGDGSGSGSGDGGNGDGQGAGDGDGGDGDGGSGGTGDAGAGKGGKDGGADVSAATITRLEKELADARKDAGRARNEAKKQAADDAVKEITQKLGEALGIVKGDEPPTAEELTKALADRDTKLSDKDAALRAKDVELAVYGRADKHKVKASALLDSRSFVKAITDLDPTAAGFGKALDEAIEKAVKANPSFAIAPAGRSGGDLSGGTGESNAKRNPSLSGAISTHYGN